MSMPIYSPVPARKHPPIAEDKRIMSQPLARQTKITVCKLCQEEGRKQLRYEHDDHGIYFICDACYSDELLKFAEDRGYYPGITQLDEGSSQQSQNPDEEDYEPSESGSDEEFEDSEEGYEDSEQ